MKKKPIKKSTGKTTTKSAAKKKPAKAAKKTAKAKTKTAKAAKKKPAKKPAGSTAKKVAKVKKKPSARATTKAKPTTKKAARKAKKSAAKAAPQKTAAKKANKPAKTAKQKTQPSAATSTSPAPKVTVSPSITGPPQKLTRDTFPKGSSKNDFRCYGPPATRDGEFESVRVCDLGCFTQDGKDSNKYYHGAVVQHKSTDNWYSYFEWGRTGAASPSFQFVACASEADARGTFEKQLHAKNDKRGEWITIAGIKTLRAKKGKDCYLVRPMATRSTGLPDARSIKTNEGAKRQTKTAATKKSKKSNIDPQTAKLMQDLAIATIAYTRGSMTDSSLPTQSAIDEARAILTEAQSRLTKIGANAKKQLKDKPLLQLTTLMYGRIPKKKPLGAAAETWMLSGGNILTWQNDLDAFESALYSTEIEEDPHVDPLADMNLSMTWISPTSKTGKFLNQWWPKATGNRHYAIGKLKVKNLWRVERNADKGKVLEAQNKVLSTKPKIAERAKYQPRQREDLTAKEQKTFKDSNTALLFHGTRSVNVSGILRESLRLPNQLVGVAITGAMFGPGLYYADDWKKSAGYTSHPSSYWAGGSGDVKGRDAFMFAADVVLGSPYVAPKWGGYTKPPKGHHCVYGKAGKSGLQNNEFVIYDTNQNQLRYLIEFTTT